MVLKGSGRSNDNFFTPVFRKSVASEIDHKNKADCSKHDFLG